MTDPKSLAKDLFFAGVAAADPYDAVMRHKDQLIAPSLIIAVGKAVNRYVKFPYISGALKVMSKPAHMLGLGDLQDFLERGYEGFKHMGDAGEFILQIEDRESKILANIYAEKEDPFDIEVIPLK